jgi:hypothetical protein
VAFRITPDITRESGLLALGAGNTIPNDSLVYRIKYAFAQFNLDDWMTKGSWARFGIQQTPWVDFDEGIYRYRFQGTTFAERVPLPTALASSDGARATGSSSTSRLLQRQLPDRRRAEARHG